MTTGYVVDASVAVKWVVEEEGSDAALALSHESLAAPSLWLAECANVLWVKARRGEIDEQEARERQSWLAEAPVLLVPLEELLEDAVALAFRLDVTIYDALYVALAQRRREPLITADGPLRTAASSDEELRQLVKLLGA